MHFRPRCVWVDLELLRKRAVGLTVWGFPAIEKSGAVCLC